MIGPPQIINEQKNNNKQAFFDFFFRSLGKFICRINICSITAWFTSVGTRIHKIRHNCSTKCANICKLSNVFCLVHNHYIFPQFSGRLTELSFICRRYHFIEQMFKAWNWSSSSESIDDSFVTKEFTFLQVTIFWNNFFLHIFSFSSQFSSCDSKYIICWCLESKGLLSILNSDSFIAMLMTAINIHAYCWDLRVFMFSAVGVDWVRFKRNKLIHVHVHWIIHAFVRFFSLSLSLFLWIQTTVTAYEQKYCSIKMII